MGYPDHTFGVISLQFLKFLFFFFEASTYAKICRPTDEFNLIDFNVQRTSRVLRVAHFTIFKTFLLCNDCFFSAFIQDNYF